ncbi:hypothetical protein [Mycetocola zhujimingii]|uniref:Uncharacterized protein n=1 Tax=Mycetocola zhujimingii TaxID=2079792 RepID=A0A2U1TB31_9MICO|nr:hypothetical protein [Mycetocola zhujimingii]PWC06102.1 hypothetical protein DF223_13110 [Mycetocola zhujimingii]
MTGIGIVLAAIGLALVGVNLFFFSRVQDVEKWDTDVVVPGGFFALSPSEVEQLSFFVAVPGGLFLLALCFIMTGRVLRGNVQTRETKGLEGGTVVSTNEILSPRAHLTWIAVAVLFWLALIVVPMLMAVGGGWPTTVPELPQTYVWANLGMYGALASATAGVLVVSFLKKQRYLAMVEAEDSRLLEPPHGVWRWLTFRWRFDLWIGGVGGALVGACWLAALAGDVVLLGVTLVIGAALLAVGIWMARQYWRAGVPLGVGESFA